jgi:transcriptional regulator with XRE-family HTH domain
MDHMKRNFVGQKVRRLRKERGMTQSELAARIGIIQSDLCRMEKGEYKVGLDSLFKILEVFGMNIGEFFDERGAEGPAAGEAELVDRFRRLSDEARVEVMDYIRFKELQERRTESMPRPSAATTPSAGTAD